MDSGASGPVAAMRPRSSAGNVKQPFQIRIDTTHCRSQGARTMAFRDPAVQLAGQRWLDLLSLSNAGAHDDDDKTHLAGEALRRRSGGRHVNAKTRSRSYYGSDHPRQRRREASQNRAASRERILAVTLNARTSFGVACRDANHLIHTPSISP